MPIDVQALVARLLLNLDVKVAADRAALRNRLQQCTPEEITALDGLIDDGGEHTIYDRLRSYAESDNRKDHVSAFALFPGLRTLPGWPGLPDFNAFDWTFESALDRLDVGGWAPSIAGRAGWTLTGDPGPMHPAEQAARRVWTSHTDAKPYVYRIPNPAPGKKVRVAIFGDAGMPRAQAHAVFRQMVACAEEDGGLAAAIHLGDIYASGSTREVKENFEDPLAALRALCEVWAIPGDHERFTDGGRPWREYVTRTHGTPFGAHGGVHRQEGSYFCLHNDTFQLIALDGNSIKYNRLPPDEANAPHEPLRQRAWLRSLLTPGTTNILLSQSPPHKAREETPTRVRIDVDHALEQGDLGKHIHAWIWGDTHHAAVYPPSATRRFLSVAAGHATHPAKITRHPDNGAFTPEPLFWEKSPRFGALRPDPQATPDARAEENVAILGNRNRNGWCLLELSGEEGEAGHATLEFRDWMGCSRYTVAFHPGALQTEAKTSSAPEDPTEGR